MYWLRKRLWSQNFLINRELISKLIRGSSISPADTVLDIGSGQGVITRELLKITSHVISIEKDPRFTDHPQNFLTYPLPVYPYKVFANIPFSITGDIMRKLLNAPNPPSDCYLIVQAEAANKFMVRSGPNTMAALLYYPWWEIQTVYKFKRSDFKPAPKVDSLLLHLIPRSKPFIPALQKNAYFDFVAHTFIYNPQAKFISASVWISRFKRIKHRHYGAYTRLLNQQNRLQKIHRTRTAPNWRKFRL